MSAKTDGRETMLTVRVNERLKRRIQEIARQRFQSPSDLIRELLTVNVEKVESRKPVGAK